MKLSQNQIECNNKILAQMTKETYFNDEGKFTKEIYYIECIFRLTHKVDRIETENKETAISIWKKITYNHETD